MDIDKHVLQYMPWLSPERQATLRADLPFLLREARTQARRPVGVQTDPYVQSYAQAFEPLIEQSPWFAVCVGDLVLRQPIKRHAKEELGVSASSVWGRGRMAMMSNVLAARRRNPGTPSPLDKVDPNPRDWFEEWQRIVENRERLERFDYALTMINTPTTVSERQAPIHMLTHMLGKGSLKLLAVGVGTGHGEARLLHLPEYPFQEADIMTYLPRSARGERHVDPDSKRNYMQYLRRPSLLKRIVMVDAMNMYDPVTRLAALGAMRIKDEVLNPGFMWRHNGLTYFIDDQNEKGGDLLEFHQVDFTDQHAVEGLRDKLQGETFDFVSFSTVLNQVSEPAERNIMINNGLSFLNDSDHAAVLIFDFFWRKGTKMVPYKVWRKNDYNLFVMQKQDIARRPEHILTAEDSRVRRLQPGKGTLLVNGKRRPFEELLREGYVAAES